MNGLAGLLGLSGSIGSVSELAVSFGVAAPSSLVANGHTDHVSLAWTDNIPGGADSFKVYRGTSSGGETLLASGLMTNSYTDSSVTNGTTYYYKVTALRGTHESAFSNESSATPLDSQSPAINVDSAGPAAVNVHFNDAVAGATGYKIYRGPSSGAETLLATASATPYVDSGLTDGASYYYKVSATAPNSESDLSNEAQAAIPNTPAGGANFTNGRTGRVDVFYSPLGADSGNLYRGTVPGGESLIYTSLSGTLYTDNTASSGTTYYYKVTRVSGGFESNLSPESVATPLDIPTNPVASPDATAGIDLSWDAMAGATSYNVYAAGTSGAESFLTNVGTTNYVHSLSSGTTYYYKITAANYTSPENNESDKSAEVSAVAT